MELNYIESLANEPEANLGCDGTRIPSTTSDDQTKRVSFDDHSCHSKRVWVLERRGTEIITQHVVSSPTKSGSNTTKGQNGEALMIAVTLSVTSTNLGTTKLMTCLMCTDDLQDGKQECPYDYEHRERQVELLISCNRKASMDR